MTKTKFKIDKNEKNIKIFSEVRGICEQYELIKDISLLEGSVEFNILNNDPFIICKYLSGDLMRNWLEIVEYK